MRVAEGRGVGFWTVGALAALLSLLSWGNLKLVALLNLHLFHAEKEAAPGWWGYLALRVPLTVLLVWTILRLPVAPPAAVKTVAAQGPRPRTFDPLMGLRALACMMVVLGHYFLVVFPFTSSGREGWFAPFLRSSPWAGVWLFFTLSGFLMGKGFVSGRYTLDAAGVRPFLRNRWLRIAPVYYMGLGVVTVLRYPAMLEPRHWWMLIEICVFDFRGDLPLRNIDALWSVSTEMQFYLLAPMLAVGLLWLKARLQRLFPVVPVLAMALGTALRMFVHHHQAMGRYGYQPLATNLYVFVIGMTLTLVPGAASLGSLGAWLARWRGALLLGGTAVFIFGISELTTGKWQHVLGARLEQYWITAPVLCVLFAAAYIYVAEAGRRFVLSPGVWATALLGVQWLGTLTYCLYVFHSDVFLAARPPGELVRLPVPLMQVLGLFPRLLLEAVGFAAFFYWMVEMPFDRRKKVGTPGLMDAP